MKTDIGSMRQYVITRAYAENTLCFLLGKNLYLVSQEVNSMKMIQWNASKKYKFHSDT
jgi:hypothetical protein